MQAWHVFWHILKFLIPAASMVLFVVARRVWKLELR